MKIAIPTNDQTNIIYHLRFAQGFMIYEIVDGRIQNKYYKKISNTNVLDKGINEATYTSITEVLSDCNFIILYAMNSEIELELNKANIEIFLTSVPDLQSSMKLFQLGKLFKLR